MNEGPFNTVMARGQANAMWINGISSLHSAIGLYDLDPGEKAMMRQKLAALCSVWDNFEWEFDGDLEL